MIKAFVKFCFATAAEFVLAAFLMAGVFAILAQSQPPNWFVMLGSALLWAAALFGLAGALLAVVAAADRLVRRLRRQS